MSKFVFPLKILTSVTILLVIVSTLDWKQALVRLTELSWPWLLASLMLYLSALVLSAWRWQRLVNVLTDRLRFSDALRFYWIGSLFSTVLPSTIGGDVMRLAMARRVGSVAIILTSVLMERVSGLLLLLAIGLLSLIMSPQIEQVLPMRDGIIVALILGLLFIPFILSRSSSWLTHLSDMPWAQKGVAKNVAAKLEQVGGSVRIYRKQPAEIWFTFALSFLFYCILFAYQGCLVYSVGGELTLGNLVFAAPLVIIISMLPISINGLGISEGAFVVLYVLVGLDPEVALAAAVLRRLTSSFMALLGIVPWLQARKQESTQEAIG